MFHHIGQAGLKLLTLSDPPALKAQTAEITGVSHHAQQQSLLGYIDYLLNFILVIFYILMNNITK